MVGDRSHVHYIKSEARCVVLTCERRPKSCEDLLGLLLKWNCVSEMVRERTQSHIQSTWVRLGGIQ